jgi:hypothetical protein
VPVFEILEARGFEALLVNARDMKNVPDRRILSMLGARGKAVAKNSGDRNRNQTISLSSKCERGDSNPHSVTQQHLKLPRLPISPRSRGEDI